MAKCSFCLDTIKPGTGKMFIKKDSKVLHFCSSKCELNMLKLNRKARTLKWTKAFEKGG